MHARLQALVHNCAQMHTSYCDCFLPRYCLIINLLRALLIQISLFCVHICPSSPMGTESTNRLLTSVTFSLTGRTVVIPLDSTPTHWLRLCSYDAIRGC